MRSQQPARNNQSLRRACAWRACACALMVPVYLVGLRSLALDAGVHCCLIFGPALAQYAVCQSDDTILAGYQRHIRLFSFPCLLDAVSVCFPAFLFLLCYLSLILYAHLSRSVVSRVSFLFLFLCRLHHPTPPPPTTTTRVCFCFLLPPPACPPLRLLLSSRLDFSLLQSPLIETTLIYSSALLVLNPSSPAASQDS